jgi:hypothetical protein
MTAAAFAVYSEIAISWFVVSDIGFPFMMKKEPQG